MKINLCAQVLSTWGKEITGNLKLRITNSKKVLKILKEGGMFSGREKEISRDVCSERSFLASKIEANLPS